MDNSRESLVEHIEATLRDGTREVPAKALAEACYSFSERHVFGDLEIGPGDALEVWAMVEKVRRDGGFPDHQRM